MRPHGQRTLPGQLDGRAGVRRIGLILVKVGVFGVAVGRRRVVQGLVVIDVGVVEEIAVLAAQKPLPHQALELAPEPGAVLPGDVGPRRRGRLGRGRRSLVRLRVGVLLGNERIRVLDNDRLPRCRLVLVIVIVIVPALRGRLFPTAAVRIYRCCLL